MTTYRNRMTGTYDLLNYSLPTRPSLLKPKLNTVGIHVRFFTLKYMLTWNGEVFTDKVEQVSQTLYFLVEYLMTERCADICVAYQM